ncbi:hypothetical protein LC653_33010 [Nostoc sp. CHAB 5784]|uniref:hypothetical protein n=1 Tax=Nostoc mirabile TaxID=2907820 RepID=UPI001E290970|nr:hypothetical protein [Nostoc mirabile]MCC5668541.1 hypothetical protein [Nostoc mirabile CHAB5784]
MAANKSTKSQVITIDDSAMEQFKVESFDVRKYNTIFYSIRDLYGRESQRQLGSDNFDWKAFKTQFEICFGRPEDCRYTTEQLLTFAQNKFNMGLEDLLAYNRKSWELRKKREQQYAQMEQINLVVKHSPEITNSPVDCS